MKIGRLFKFFYLPHSSSLPSQTEGENHPAPLIWCHVTEGPLSDRGSHSLPQPEDGETVGRIGWCFGTLT